MMQSKNLRKSEAYYKLKTQQIIDRSLQPRTELKSDSDKDVILWNLGNKETKVNKVKNKGTKNKTLAHGFRVFVNEQDTVNWEEIFWEIFYKKMLLVAIWLDDWSSAGIWLVMLETIISYETSCKKG